MKYVLMILITFIFVGCGTSITAITIPIEKKIIDKNNARVIVYRKRGFMENLTVIESLVVMDGKPIGIIGNGKHVDVKVKAGHHILSTESQNIDLEKTFFFEAGKTYFIERWISTGPIFLYSNLSLTEPITEYQTMVYIGKSNAIYKKYEEVNRTKIKTTKNHSSKDTIEQLIKISELYEKGYLTKKEFEVQKKKLLE